MQCIECRKEIEYGEEYMKHDEFHDIICENPACRETYALEHTTPKELAEHVVCMLIKTPIGRNIDINKDINEECAEYIGGYVLLEIIKAGNEIPQFIEDHYTGNYTKCKNDEPDEALLREWRQDKLSLQREYERSVMPYGA